MREGAVQYYINLTRNRRYWFESVHERNCKCAASNASKYPHLKIAQILSESCKRYPATGPIYVRKFIDFRRSN